MKRLNEVILIAILVLAVSVPLVYGNIVKFSDWVYGLAVAWAILATAYLSLALMKWK